ncbi:MAG: PAS domain-containing protein [Desulfamplus sp.]|nr:PAS domain-containing protein [Desulfamplus sp.]MBF0390022.1 PAS domain-containing protein [Desulfamplus sp.]
MAENILLIENNKEHATALQFYLERSGIVVSIGTTTEEMVSKIATKEFEILLVNPFINGSSVCPIVKELKLANPLVQVIIFCFKQHLNQAMDEIGTYAIHFLEIPINSKALDLAITRARKYIANARRIAVYSGRLADLEHDRTLYHQLFNEVPCYISIQNQDMRLIGGNSLFQKDFGNEIGEYCYQIYKHRTSPCPTCPVIKTFADGKSHSTEEVVTSLSGQQYHVLTQTAPIFNDDGDITQVMEIATDITQIRQLQGHLSSLGLMLGSMSHGVKGMLTALDGGIYQMASGLEKNDPERIKKAFDIIKQMADRIKKMVLEILYYAKSRELQYKTVDVVNLVRTVITTVANLARKNHVTIETDIPEYLGEMDIDANWLQAALVNLSENAVEACIYDKDKNKKYRVEFRLWEDDDNRVCISIKDNGMGMDQDTYERMFTLFFTSKGSQGTGLGLFIANHVIKQHGGYIKVKSSLGEGTYFEITIPRKKPEESIAPFGKLIEKESTY